MNHQKTIILAGGSGFLGRALTDHFLKRGYCVTVFTRRPVEGERAVRQVRWDGQTLGDWAEHLEGAMAVINLCGRSVNCRYTAKNRRSMMQSRVASTRVLGEAIKRCRRPPAIWLNASTATIYKHTFDQPWDESGVIGAHPEAKDAFSIQIAEAWEREVDQAITPDTRKVLLRSAMVLGLGANSVFPALRRLAVFGLGGRMGSGRQYVSWIHEKDFCRAVEWLLEHHEIAGTVNLAAPHPVPNAEMMRGLRRICGIPIGLPATRWMLELGALILRTETELILKSRRVIGKRLLAGGFAFQFEHIQDALADLNRKFRG